MENRMTVIALVTIVGLPLMMTAVGPSQSSGFAQIGDVDSCPPTGFDEIEECINDGLDEVDLSDPTSFFQFFDLVIQIVDGIGSGISGLFPVEVGGLKIGKSLEGVGGALTSATDALSEIFGRLRTFVVDALTLPTRMANAVRDVLVVPFLEAARWFTGTFIVDGIIDPMTGFVDWVDSGAQSIIDTIEEAFGL